MVVGAGRGPLVRSTINASKNTKRKIQIFVIEKNPNAIVTLQALKEEQWPTESESSAIQTIIKLCDNFSHLSFYYRPPQI